MQACYLTGEPHPEPISVKIPGTHRLLLTAHVCQFNPQPHFPRNPTKSVLVLARQEVYSNGYYSQYEGILSLDEPFMQAYYAVCDIGEKRSDILQRSSPLYCLCAMFMAQQGM